MKKIIKRIAFIGLLVLGFQVPISADLAPTPNLIESLNLNDGLGGIAVMIAIVVVLVIAAIIIIRMIRKKK